MRARTMLGATIAVLLATPAAANAGGWWSWIDVPDALGLGETVTARADVMFPDIATAEAAVDLGGYHAYLLREVDQGMLDDAMTQPYRQGWWEPPAEGIWLAEIELSDLDTNLASATATFELPAAVAPGMYSLMFCTSGCEEAMADVVPRMGLRVFAEPTTAGLAREVTALSDRFVEDQERLRLDLERTRGILAESIGRHAGDVRADVGEVQGSLDALAAAVDALQPPVEDGTPWMEHTGWFVAGLATAWALGSRRRRREEPPEDLPPVPDDAGELVTGPPVPMSSVRR